MTHNDQSNTAPIRVLVIAEAANPALTSVALIGWSLSSALGEVAEVHVATEIRNADEIAKHGWAPSFYTAFDNQKYQNTAFKLANLLRGGQSLGWTIYSALANMAYPQFEKKVWKHFKARLKAGEFDIVHRVTPLSPTSASPMAKWCKKIGVPYICGPINGGLPWPKGYDSVRRKEREWLSYIRNMYKLQPAVRQVYRNASAIIAASLYTKEDIPCADPDKVVYLPENAIDQVRFPREPFLPATKRLRICFVGRLVPYKGADLVLKAASEMIQNNTAHLDIIGDGPQMPQLKAYIEKERLSHGVNLYGWVDHEKVSELLSESQIFAFPSIREFGGGVVLESMAKGLMPIIVDYGGPAELVPDATGIKIPLADPERLVNDMHNWFKELLANLDLLEGMRDSAQEYVYTNFTWEAKAAQILQIYKWVLGHESEKPDFGTPLPYKPIDPS